MSFFGEIYNNDLQTVKYICKYLSIILHFILRVCRFQSFYLFYREFYHISIVFSGYVRFAQKFETILSKL